LRGAALASWAIGKDGLGLFLLHKGRPGRRFTDVDDDEATREASFGLFLLPRGRPRPRFSITAPVSRSTTPTSAIGRFCLAKETLDEIWRRKTMQCRRLTMKGLGFSLASWRTLFISNPSSAFMNYRSN
jgi:hypothetical protein